MMLKELGPAREISLDTELRKATPSLRSKKALVTACGVGEKGDSSTITRELTWLLHTGSTRKAPKMCLRDVHCRISP